MHADRLRPLKEMPNDYRWKQNRDTQQESTKCIKQVTWQIVVGEPGDANSQALVHWVDADMSFLTDPENTLRRKLTSACLDYAREIKSGSRTWRLNGVLPMDVPDATLATDVIMFAVLPTLTEDAHRAQRQLKQAYLNCLERAKRRGL